MDVNAEIEKLQAMIRAEIANLQGMIDSQVDQVKARIDQQTGQWLKPLSARVEQAQRTICLLQLIVLAMLVM